MLQVIEGRQNVVDIGNAQEDILDCLTEWVKSGKIYQMVVIVEDKENSLFLWTDANTNAEVVGLMEIAKNNYIHGAQHE